VDKAIGDVLQVSGKVGHTFCCIMKLVVSSAYNEVLSGYQPGKMVSFLWRPTFRRPSLSSSSGSLSWCGYGGQPSPVFIPVKAPFSGLLSAFWLAMSWVAWFLLSELQATNLLIYLLPVKVDCIRFDTIWCFPGE